MSEEPRYTTGEHITVAVTVVSIFGLMALGVYCLHPVVGTGAGFWITVGAAVVVGVLLVLLAFLAIDFYRRGGAAVRAVNSIREGNVEKRLQSVAMLRFIGKSAVFYINRVQRDGVGGGFTGGIFVWHEQRLLDKYVMPGLRIAARDGNISVRRHTCEALQEIGTWEALAILNDMREG